MLYRGLLGLVSFSLLIVFSGCVSAPSLYHEQEESLSTEGNLQKFHAVVHYPEEIRLNFPGFIVGIEKSPRGKITKGQELKINKVNRTSGIEQDIKRLETDQKLMSITHIYQYKKDKRNQFRNIKTIPLYNLYKENKKNIPYAFEKSWDALKALRTAIVNSLTSNSSSYDSIIVFSMGWNTSQEEAVRNFNSIYRNIKMYGEEKFNPLFIGVTWPSEWESSILPDFMLKLASFPNKANDADEVGLSWLGALLHHTLKDIQKPLIVIGHSFGARATSMATFEGNTIYKDKPYEKNNIKCLIGIQGAYSINRFLEKGTEKVLYDYKDTKVVLTSSYYDTAMDIGKWAPYVGNDSTYNSYCKNQNINCIKYDKDQTTVNTIKNNLTKGNILYINGDSIIQNNVYNSGGGAHSDIYDDEMGLLLWKVIQNIE